MRTAASPCWVQKAEVEDGEGQTLAVMCLPKSRHGFHIKCVCELYWNIVKGVWNNKEDWHFQKGRGMSGAEFTCS